MLGVPGIGLHMGWTEHFLSTITVPAVSAAVHHTAHTNMVSHLHLPHTSANMGDNTGQLVARHTGVVRHTYQSV